MPLLGLEIGGPSGGGGGIAGSVGPTPTPTPTPPYHPPPGGGGGGGSWGGTPGSIDAMKLLQQAAAIEGSDPQAAANLRARAYQILQGVVGPGGVPSGGGGGGGGGLTDEEIQAYLDALSGGGGGGGGYDGGGGGYAGLTPEEIAKIVSETNYQDMLTQLEPDKFAFEKEKFATGLEQQKKEAATLIAEKLLSDYMGDVSSRRSSAVNLLQTVLPRSATPEVAGALGRMFKGVTGGEAFPTQDVPIDWGAFDKVNVDAQMQAYLDEQMKNFGLAEGGVIGAADGTEVEDYINTLIGFDPAMEGLKTGVGSIEALGNLFGYLPSDFVTQLLSTVMPAGSQFTLPGMEDGVYKTYAQRQFEASQGQQAWQNTMDQSRWDAAQAQQGVANELAREQMGLSREQIAADSAARAADTAARIQAAQIAAESSRYGAELGAGASRYGSELGLEGTKYGADIGLQGTKYSADMQERIGRLVEQGQRAKTLAEMMSQPRRLFESLYYQSGMGPNSTARSLDDRRIQAANQALYGGG